MGLYKKNYEVKDLGITLPEAFAIVRKIDRQGDKGMAELWVHSSRENAKTLQFLERKLVPFKCNDGDNPYEAAYTTAVTPEERTRYTSKTELVKEWVNGEEKEVEKSVPTEEKYMFAYFDGWVRDNG